MHMYIWCARCRINLQKILSRWKRQATAQSLILLFPFGVFAQVLLDSITKLNKPIAEETRAPPDELTNFAILGFATSIFFLFFMYFMLCTSWRSPEFLLSEFKQGSTSNRSNPGKASNQKSLTSVSSHGSTGIATCATTSLGDADTYSDDDELTPAAGTNDTHTKSVSLFDVAESRPGSRKPSVQVNDFAVPSPPGRKSTIVLPPHATFQPDGALTQV